MPAQRRDYILDQIDLVRQFVAKLVRGDGQAGLDEMLQLTFNLQEKLFGLPPADFLAREVSEQIAILQRGESPEAGREKCLTYARLLKETASLYAFRGRDDLAAGARQLALHVALSVALQHPHDEAAAALVDELVASLDLAQLHPPVLELLERYGQL